MSLSLFACGDIVNFHGKKTFIDDELTEIISGCDISICNFEAPILTKNMRPIQKAGPHIYQSSQSVECLKLAGFNLASLANNHIYDYGEIALQNTLNEFEKLNIPVIGAGLSFEEAYSTQIIEKNDMTIALIAGAENEFGCLSENSNRRRGGYAWLYHPNIDDHIVKLKGKVDFIVLIAHAGVENIDFPIKEWRERYKRLCDLGVDIVIGHHPHVPQGYEKHNKSTIFYSLGNFYFDTAGYEFKSDESYSIVLNLKKSGLESINIIYHKKINGITCRIQKKDVDFDLENLNNLLQDGYEKRNSEIAVELFERYYYGYYQRALGVIPSKLTFFESLKYFVKKILFSKKNSVKRDLLLLHNIRIDSHRFIVQRALSLLREHNRDFNEK